MQTHVFVREKTRVPDTRRIRTYLEISALVHSVLRWEQNIAATSLSDEQRLI